MFRLIKSKKGFTLTELLIVIIILGIVMALAIPMGNSLLKTSQKNRCESAQLLIYNAMEKYIDSSQYVWAYQVPVKATEKGSGTVLYQTEDYIYYREEGYVPPETIKYGKRSVQYPYLNNGVVTITPDSASPDGYTINPGSTGLSVELFKTYYDGEMSCGNPANHLEIEIIEPSGAFNMYVIKVRCVDGSNAATTHISRSQMLM